ncbi:hypothetical protein ADZ37_09900 [Pannonibacter phragmitetus]|uniref:hypothetical protein n=1 Tax=Pannonibacter phragmitetus TaxID=121719 RepID=UPI00067BAC00|nr:hypothetical protein [Pannonibacter phragmitetus]KND19316.1 hypothetical protein ADZ37_09900 [Pannonibacter phragmitetus]
MFEIAAGIVIGFFAILLIVRFWLVILGLCFLVALGLLGLIAWETNTLPMVATVLVVVVAFQLLAWLCSESDEFSDWLRATKPRLWTVVASMWLLFVLTVFSLVCLLGLGIAVVTVFFLLTDPKVEILSAILVIGAGLGLAFFVGRLLYLLGRQCAEDWKSIR